MTTTRRKNRETGTHIIVQRADDGDGWETICDEHGTVCVHDTRKVAEYMAASPLTWCEICNGSYAEIPAHLGGGKMTA